MEVWVTAAISIVTSIITALVTLWVAAGRTRADTSISDARTRQDFALEFAAETVAKALMSDAEWRWRTFEVIKHHLGGFEDDELRKLLVRAGAIRATAKGGEEVWGLLERNRALIGLGTVNAGRLRRRLLERVMDVAEPGDAEG
jgi:hypothetical protein